MKFSRTFFVSALMLAALSLPVSAMDLQQARSQGILGEKSDGYVNAMQSDANAQKLASDVNNRRRQEYERISKENGQPVDVVAKLAAAQIISKLPAGAMYQGDDGSWKKR